MCRKLYYCSFVGRKIKLLVFSWFFWWYSVWTSARRTRVIIRRVCRASSWNTGVCLKNGQQQTLQFVDACTLFYSDKMMTYKVQSTGIDCYQCKGCQITWWIVHEVISALECSYLTLEMTFSNRGRITRMQFFSLVCVKANKMQKWPLLACLPSHSRWVDLVNDRQYNKCNKIWLYSCI